MQSFLNYTITFFMAASDRVQKKEKRPVTLDLFWKSFGSVVDGVVGESKGFLLEISGNVVVRKAFLKIQCKRHITGRVGSYDSQMAFHLVSL